MLLYFEGTVRTVVMMTGALAQKTITATSTLAEMTRILKPRCRKWMKRNAANFERLRCFIPKLKYTHKMPVMMLNSAFYRTSRWRLWSSRMSWSLGNDPKSTDRAFRNRSSTTGTNCYKRYWVWFKGVFFNSWHQVQESEFNIHHCVHWL